jgi:thiol-disulfide isomerase/thioredoxin
MTSAAGAQGAGPGAGAPEINYKTLDGKRVRLSDFRGRPVVVTFWATWCPPCQEEFPALIAAQKRYGGEGLEVLAVNQLDQERQGERDVRRFVAEFAVTFPVVLDRQGRSQQRPWQVLAFPTTVFIDSAGVIRRRSQGPLSAGELERGLAEILNPATAPPA